MRNDFYEAPDEPVGICLANEGFNDCSKWPDLVPSPCCWLSCSELCGAACYHPFIGHGEQCPDFGGDRIECTSASQHPQYGQKRVVAI